MLELHLQRSGTMLTGTLGESTFSAPLSALLAEEETWQRISEDAAAYGRDLFQQTFPDAQLRTMLSTLPAHERLVLVADDPLIAAIPWEYLRDENGKLLASRLNFVRGLPAAERQEGFSCSGPLEIVAVVSSPVDSVPLNVEREWSNLVQAVQAAAQTGAITLQRVRPPTPSGLEQALSPRSASIVHFMGHSGSRAGKALLEFEDARARSHLLDAADFVDLLHSARTYLVILNSCLSAVVAHTEFGNIARALVQRGCPYALGMQFAVPDETALVLSQALYKSLLQGVSVEDAVTQTRRALAESERPPLADWLAAIPVLYTSLRTPAPAIELTSGQPRIQPDPEQLQQRRDLTALPPAEHFVGRGKEIGAALDALLSPSARGFVLLHGLGGIGKTSLARVVAERISWHYLDRVLTFSFETFASLDETDQVTVNEQFADRFYSRLARFYGLDPAQYPFPTDLQQAILQRRMHLRSLLVLDNIETLIDAQRCNHPGGGALASFISRLKEGDGAILLTSRMLPPSDWGDCQIISLSGFSDEAGAALFLALLPDSRKHLAALVARQALSRRVQGHPFSIRLLAGRFADEAVRDLITFLEHIEGELELAEQATPISIEDPERHKTLYACMDYSVRRLTPEQRPVLIAVSIFQTPFLPEFAAYLLNDKVQTPVHLQHLVRLGLLTSTVKSFQEGELLLLELHSMLRWYIQQRFPIANATLQERCSEVYEHLARQSHENKGGYDQSSQMRYLVRQSLPDFEAALRHLPPRGRGDLAYHLATPYQRLGQNRHALALCEQALEMYQELEDVSSVAKTQFQMARVLAQLGKPQDASTLFEQALRTYQELGDEHGVATAQQGMADMLTQLGKPQQALALFEQALHTYQKLGEVRAIAITQASKADALAQLGKFQEALTLYEHTLRTDLELGEVRNVATTQQAMAYVLQQLGKSQEALALYEQALHTYQELGDVHGAVTLQANLSQLLLQLGERRGLIMAWEAYTSLGKEGFSHDAQVLQESLIFIKKQVLGPEQFDTLWQEAMNEMQPDWLRKVQISSFPEEVRRAAEQLNMIVANTITVMTQMPEKRKEWHEEIGGASQKAQEINRSQDAEFFNAILAILDNQSPVLPEGHPYAYVIDSIQAGIAAGGQDEKKGILSLYAELVPRSIAALLGSPQEKLAHMHSLTQLASETSDEDLKALISTIQVALFSPDLSQHGHDLRGVYRQAWETITTRVEANGVDPRVFELITRETLAALSTPARRSEWRNHLVPLRNQATAHGDRNMVALLDAVLALLDAGGHPAGLGENLKGVYAKTWQSIVRQLPS